MQRMHMLNFAGFHYMMRYELNAFVKCLSLSFLTRQRCSTCTIKMYLEESTVPQHDSVLTTGRPVHSHSLCMMDA